MSAPAHIVPKPWGHEELWATGPGYVGKILVIREGHRLSLQHHERKVETLRVLRGQVACTLGPSIEALSERVLGPGEVVHLPAGWVHRLRAITEVEIVEVSTPELDDVVRHADDYGRQ